MKKTHVVRGEISRRAGSFFLFCLMAGLSVGPWNARANPDGGSVAAGSATISSSGNTLTVTNSNGTVINWNSFSIAAGETTKFLQPNASSAVLNRVTGTNLSEIYGTLSSNGHVFLVNPNGIVVGAGGMINTAGFVASTLNITDSDFQSGNYHFTGASTAGVQNLGTIQAQTGDVYIIARQIDNQGTIQAAQGKAGLYASDEVYLATSQDGEGAVRVTATSFAGGTGIQNSGLIQAAQAELKATGNMYALAINNTGAIRATGTTVKNGVVRLVALGGTINNSALIKAQNADGSGGIVKLQTGAGGTTLHSGTIDVSSITAGQKGGYAELTGDHVGLTGNAVVDASGPAGGGEILVGGDAHGANADVFDASMTYVGQDVVLDASATDSGDGGKVVVWGDDQTQYYGFIVAKGGPNGGNGGWVETSGHVLDFQGRVDTTAAKGQTGTLLLDPSDVMISESSDSAISAGPTFIPTGSFTNSVINIGTLTTALATSNVTIQTIGSPDNGTGNGDIFVQAGVTSSSGHSLTLQAYHNIDIQTGIDLNGGDLTATATNGSITVEPISLSVGNLSMTSAGAISVQGSVDAAGNVTLTSTGSTVDISGGIQATSGNVTAQANGALSVSGTGFVAGKVVKLISDTGAITVSSSMATAITAATSLALTALNNIATSSNMSVTGTGGAVLDAGKGVFSQTAGVIDVGTGDLTIKAGDAISWANGGLKGTGNLTFTTSAASLKGGDFTVGSNSSTGAYILGSSGMIDVGSGSRASSFQSVTFAAQTTGTLKVANSGPPIYIRNSIADSLQQVTTIAFTGYDINFNAPLLQSLMGASTEEFVATNQITIASNSEVQIGAAGKIILKANTLVNNNAVGSLNGLDNHTVPGGTYAVYLASPTGNTMGNIVPDATVYSTSFPNGTTAGNVVYYASADPNAPVVSDTPAPAANTSAGAITALGSDTATQEQKDTAAKKVTSDTKAKSTPPAPTPDTNTNVQGGNPNSGPSTTDVVTTDDTKGKGDDGNGNSKSDKIKGGGGTPPTTSSTPPPANEHVVGAGSVGAIGAAGRGGAGAPPPPPALNNALTPAVRGQLSQSLRP